MIKRPSGERTDARNADNRRPDRPYPQARRLQATRLARRPCACRVHPLGLDGVEPRTLLRKKAAHDPHSASALLDFSVVSSQPAPDLPGDMPARVVPDEEQNLLADLFELLQAPLKELGRYGTDGPSVNEAQPRIADLRKVESVAGEDGFRSSAGVVSLATDC